MLTYNIIAESLLTRLALSPQQVATLSSSPRSRLLNFLIRWEAYQDALDCLALLKVDALVSLQDMQVRALEGLGRLPEAIAIMEARLQQRDSSTARAQLGQLWLATDEIERALPLALELTNGTNALALHWSFLGDVHLSLGDLDAAEVAYLQHQQVAPSSRRPQMGLMVVHQRRGDLVTSAAYAVRAFGMQEGDYELPVYAFRELRDYFAEIGDENRRQAAEEQLAERFATEVAEMEALIAAVLYKTGSLVLRKQLSQAVPQRIQRDRDVVPLPPSSPAVTDLATIPVSEDERKTIASSAHQYFSFPSLRAAQTEIIACAQRGEDVLAVLPTGAGKSLCYQLPALEDKGVTLVISPLIALMKDQIDSLPSTVRRQAIAMNSTMEGSNLNQAIRDIAQGRYKLVYAAPERLRQPPFLHALRQAGPARLVVDEAHCVSVWGHDFRPDYLFLKQAHCDLGAPPILALTATAPPRVRQDIERQLFGVQAAATSKQMRLIATDIHRPNLHLHVIKMNSEDDRLRHLLQLCDSFSGNGIVYARRRDLCEELAALLCRYGVNAEAYHAGLPPDDRAAIQDRFMQGDSRVIVATVAFGMGVDKANIRFLIHYGLPDSVEAYYQEVGRAGRDGQDAHCVMLYTTSDKALLTKRANEGLLTKEFLRTVYRTIQKHVHGDGPSAVTLDDLLRDLSTDDTAVRVALSVLEQVGLLIRHYDAPRTVTLRWLPGPPNSHFEQLARQARLQPNQEVDRNFQQLAAMAQSSIPVLEAVLLHWQKSGYLAYRVSGRDLLLALPPAPNQVGAMIDSLLDQFSTIQRQRVTEIYDYAHSRHCRHGHLANYLGGFPRANCGACDNCGAASLPTGRELLPDEEQQRRTILLALHEQHWGKRNLIALLRGDPTVGERGQGAGNFGALAFRSENALGKLVDGLVDRGAIRTVPLPNGGIALAVTPQGRQVLRMP